MKHNKKLTGTSKPHQEAGRPSENCQDPEKNTENSQKNSQKDTRNQEKSLKTPRDQQNHTRNQEKPRGSALRALLLPAAKRGMRSLPGELYPPDDPPRPSRLKAGQGLVMIMMIHPPSSSMCLSKLSSEGSTQSDLGQFVLLGKYGSNTSKMWVQYLANMGPILGKYGSNTWEIWVQYLTNG